MTIREVSFKNFGKCLEMSNGAATLLVTLDVGPRVISWSLAGRENLFLEDIDRAFANDKPELHQFFQTEENWYIYGGHRLWSSPESFPASYVPDNAPEHYEVHGNTVTFTPPPRVQVGEQHEIEITLDEKAAKADLKHKITCISDAPIEIAAWCLTVMDKGLLQIIPQCKKETGLLSNRRLVLWEYTDIQDERFTLHNDFITLRQTDKDSSFKVGINNEDGWSMILGKGQLFLKSFNCEQDAVYPDYNVNYETFTNKLFMEAETLSPLKKLQKGDSLQHTEHWSLFECQSEPDITNSEELKTFVSRYL